ncbi:hypothetical protein TraAM80_05672 [Trypanosoma rangeli]|uniref:Uncharacterized protein n=1 Tax=Trypanosoma rangeli TaxID=5698 RepID=A0A422NDD4_TRYRA|nr:uncharacterized protein TraAM80_05672 [Trypanosoma rangeli]RNF03500.1 hypothetical protein TraAM80_05672 [Trypanosoma rangeli]|eukprot:RNF03500.1 hypothetical protein TraAM80_05672 [Trypanosoma rangeli]
MTFVFEARRLPFGDGVGPMYGPSPMDPGSMDAARLNGLPRWKRRLLPHVLNVVEQFYTPAASLELDAELQGWTVALRIVEELPELEMAYSRILEFRKRQRAGDMTEEELMMEELLRERMGSDYCRDTDDDIDIAMCFNVDGAVVSIGSADMFGGHGYHAMRQP